MLNTHFETLPDSRRLRVARLGSGPPLVLLHGYPDNLQIWSELAPRLAECCEVIAPDWPGMGHSDSWPGGATPEHLADRLRALFDFWHLERAHLVAMDMGGQAALAFAARHPDCLDHLVVMNSLAFGDEKTSWEIRVMRRFGWNRFILRHFPGLVFHRAETTFMPRGSLLPKELRADLWQSFQRPEVRAFIAKMCAGYQGTLARLPELYSRIACPTLVLWGERDKHFPPIQAERLHVAIPQSQLQIVRGGEHWMAWDRADEVAGAIRGFCMDRESSDANKLD